MALGKKLFEINAPDMIRGMSTSSTVSDGGFSPETNQINLTATPGVIYAPAVPTDKSTNVAGEIIASCEDGQAVSSVDRVFLDDEGHFYSWNGTTMTLLQTDASNSYVQGKTDMAPYKGAVWATSDDTLVKWIVDSSFDASFVTGLSSTVPHPLLVYEDSLYFGDANVLKRINDASDSTPDSILTLPSNQVIVALAIDPGTGKMLISTTQALNISGTLNSVDRVQYYDGFSNKVLRVVYVDEMITAFYPVGGTLYIGYGQNLGYWSGSGIQFLRQLNISFANTTLLYKQHFANIGTTLYCIEGTQILAYGPVLSEGNRVFYYAFKNLTNSNTLTHIASIGQNLLGIAFETDKFLTWSASSVATGNSIGFYSNDYEFDDEVWIRRVRLIYANQQTAGISPGEISFLDENGVVTTTGNSGVFSLLNNSGANSAFFDIDNINIRVKEVRIFLDLLGGQNTGIKRIIAYGELANLP